MRVSLGGERVVRVIERIAQERGYPTRTVVDNGPEFTSRAVDRWSYDHSVDLHFIQPGRPMQNAFVESFNGRFRDECLSQHWFTSLVDARCTVEEWRNDYNQVRPHGSLGRIVFVKATICDELHDPCWTASGTIELEAGQLPEVATEIGALVEK